MEKLRKFFTEDKIGIQLYSFVKTYVVSFITLYYYGTIENSKDPFDLAFLLIISKYSFLVVIRNVFKLVTEKNAK